MPVTDGNRVVAEVLATTVERMATADVSWCPAATGEKLVELIARRDLDLSQALQRMVRFVRLLHFVGGPGHRTLLYVNQLTGSGCPQLSTRYFTGVVEKAGAAGRLPPDAVRYGVNGVTLLEPAMASLLRRELVPFSIGYSGMPLLAALYDLVQNALGFAAVEARLAPVLTTHEPTTDAVDIGRTLTRDFEKWLTEHLDTSYHLRQARAMQAFLLAQGECSEAAIDDATVLAFWAAQARLPASSRVDGFVLYKSAARAMLIYRQELRHAAMGRIVDTPVPLDPLSPRRLVGVPSVPPIEDPGMPTEPPPMVFAPGEAWRSPLVELAGDVTAKVKWLTMTEQEQLAHVFGDGHRAGSTGLTGAQRYDMRLWRTLLRADVFGPTQAALVQRLRTKETPEQAIAGAMSGVNDNAYPEVVAVYVRTRTQLAKEAHAALHCLALHGRPEAGMLTVAIGSPAALAALREAVAETNGGEHPSRETDVALQLAAIGQHLQAVAAASATDADGPLQALMRDAAKAYATVNRVGFRNQDLVDAAIIDAMAAGAEPVTRLLSELDAVIAALSKLGRPGSIDSDRAAFDATFKELYPSNALGA